MQKLGINPKLAFYLLIAAVSEMIFGVSYIILNMFVELPHVSAIIAFTLLTSSGLFVILALRLHKQEKMLR